MSDVIHLLPDHIANQIAAGEVIQRPASVVKELVENSVDAGARNITVNIKDAGRTLIQVVDDGKGMSETDARMAFERHATSKIASVNDLFSLHTMGFRGEALPSIAAVSQVELLTKIKGGDIGTLLSINGSMPDTVMPEACNEGSIFSVKNLFYNVPARRKFLKSNETEFRHIISEFERIALVHPQISFKLRHNEIVILDLPASGHKQRIILLFGKAMNEKLLSVDTNTSLVNISGFIGQPTSARKQGYKHYFFVNGRYMRHAYFQKAVMHAYEKMIPAGEMPDFFVYFTLDPSTIDVNIHPTKTEIKFEHEIEIWQIVCSAVRKTLATSNAIPSIDFDAAGVIEIPVYNPTQKSDASPAIHTNKDYNPFQATSDWKTLYEGFENERPAVVLTEKNRTQKSEPESISVDLKDNNKDMLFDEFRHPCFQYKNRYIITPLKSGLVIVDQHRAHVRVLYERYMGYIIHHHSVSQKLLFPEIVEFTATEASQLATLHDELRFLGFELVSLGGNSYAIHATPVEMSGGNPADHIKNIVTAAMECETNLKGQINEKMALSLARTTAISTGKVLTSEEMEMMVASLFAIEANGITPDGLPVLTILTDEELINRM